jgi:hypothetical protein
MSGSVLAQFPSLAVRQALQKLTGSSDLCLLAIGGTRFPVSSTEGNIGEYKAKVNSISKRKMLRSDGWTEPQARHRCRGRRNSCST